MIRAILGTFFINSSLSIALVSGSFQGALAEFPYQTSSGNELPILGSSALLFGLGAWADVSEPGKQPLSLEKITTLDPKMINTLDRAATTNWSPSAAHLSDILMYSAAVAPLSMSLTDVGSKEPLIITTMHFETLLLNGGATYLFKSLFRRTRPFVYNPDQRIPEGLKMSRTARRSFPSGHTSTTFASMVFLATVYGQMYPDSESRKWVWAGCLTTAGVTGYLRYAAGYHYPTDILAGAALGAFTGWLVPQLHEINRDGPEGTISKGNMVLGFTIGF